MSLKTFRLVEILQYCFLSLSLSLSLKLVFSIFKQKPEVLLLLLLLLPATNINTRQNIASGKTHMLTLHLFRSHSLSPFLSFSLSPSLTLTSITLFHTPTHANTHALIAPHNALAQIHIIPSLSLSLSLSFSLSFFHTLTLSLSHSSTLTSPVSNFVFVQAIGLEFRSKLPFDRFSAAFNPQNLGQNV